MRCWGYSTCTSTDCLMDVLHARTHTHMHAYTYIHTRIERGKVQERESKRARERERALDGPSTATAFIFERTPSHRVSFLATIATGCDCAYANSEAALSFSSSCTPKQHTKIKNKRYKIGVTRFKTYRVAGCMPLVTSSRHARCRMQTCMPKHAYWHHLKKRW